MREAGIRSIKKFHTFSYRKSGFVDKAISFEEKAMQIRYISATDDRNEISKIYEESWRYAYKGILPQDYADSIATGTWAKNFDNPGWNTVLCTENEKYTGTGNFCKSRFEKYGDCGEVISICFFARIYG